MFQKVVPVTSQSPPARLTKLSFGRSISVRSGRCRRYAIQFTERFIAARFAGTHFAQQHGSLQMMR
ncbi:MAG: hypothetical protein KDI47_16890 [Gammaproteobacteria bacterium]|nr:hypothetical protein [Gammaproteobacteria bacterium]